METKKTLLTILEEREALDAEMLARQGEITEDMANLFILNAEEMKQKIQNYVNLTAVLDKESEFQKQKADAHYAKSKAMANMSKHIDDQLKHLMSFAGITRAQGIDNDVVLSKSKPALVVNEDVNAWEFGPYLKTRIEKEIDKDAIRAALDQGLSVEGARYEERFRLSKPVRNILKGKSHEQKRTD